MNNNHDSYSSIDIERLMQQTIEKTLQKVNRLAGDTIQCTAFAEMWFEYKAPLLSESTRERNEILYRNNIEPYFRNQTLTDITVPSLQHFLNETGKTRKPSTMKVIKSIIGQIFTWAYAQGHINKNPIDFVSVARGEEDHKRPLTMTEIKAILKASHTHRLWIAPIILLCTGMRKSELLALTWDDIDFTNKTIIISKGYVKTPKGNRNILRGTKTRKSNRVIPIDARLVSLLQDYKALHGQGRQFVIGQRYKDKRVDSRTFDRHIDQWSQKAGIGHISSHYFRHTFATMAYENRQQTLTIAQQLGHATTRMVETVYIHRRIDTDLRLCVDVVGKKIFGDSYIDPTEDQ